MDIQIKDIKYDYGKFKVRVPSNNSPSTGTSSNPNAGVSNNIGTWTKGTKDGYQMPGCDASGRNAVAEGYNTEASGNYGSHAEGHCTDAIGDDSHTEGDGTLALNDHEHAEGTYNVSNTGSASKTTRHSIGIGDNSSTRKNAFEVMQNGDIYAYGVGGYDGTNAGQNGVSSIQQAFITQHQSLTGYAQIWTGTQAQYDALSPNYSNTTIYIIT